MKKSTIRKVVRTLIWHINNSEKLLTDKWKKNSTKKPVTKLVLSQNWFVNLSEYTGIFWDFFLIFQIFFFSFEKTIKSHEIWICFRKKTTYYTQEVSG